MSSPTRARHSRSLEDPSSNPAQGRGRDTSHRAVRERTSRRRSAEPEAADAIGSRRARRPHDPEPALFDRPSKRRKSSVSPGSSRHPTRTGRDRSRSPYRSTYRDRSGSRTRKPAGERDDKYDDRRHRRGRSTSRTRSRNRSRSRSSVRNGSRTRTRNRVGERFRSRSRSRDSERKEPKSRSSRYEGTEAKTRSTRYEETESKNRSRRSTRKESISPTRSRSPPPRSRAPLPSQEVAFRGEASPRNGALDKPIEKQKPNFKPTGLLAREANLVAGTKISLKYNEPPEARKPPASQAWQLFVFKGADLVDEVPLYTRSCWLLGREAAVADIHVEHPSASKQHAVIQFRHSLQINEFGDRKNVVKPYLIDLESANKTRLNGDKLQESRYYEVRDKDVMRIGLSEREYVFMLPPKQ